MWSFVRPELAGRLDILPLAEAHAQRRTELRGLDPRVGGRRMQASDRQVRRRGSNGQPRQRSDSYSHGGQTVRVHPTMDLERPSARPVKEGRAKISQARPGHVCAGQKRDAFQSVFIVEHKFHKSRVYSESFFFFEKKNSNNVLANMEFSIVG